MQNNMGMVVVPPLPPGRMLNISAEKYYDRDKRGFIWYLSRVLPLSSEMFRYWPECKGRREPDSSDSLQPGGGLDEVIHLLFSVDSWHCPLFTVEDPAIVQWEGGDCRLPAEGGLWGQPGLQSGGGGREGGGGGGNLPAAQLSPSQYHLYHWHHWHPDGCQSRQA